MSPLLNSFLNVLRYSSPLKAYTHGLTAIVKLNERIGIYVGDLIENDQNAINVGQRLDVVHGQVFKSYSQKNLQNRFKGKEI